MRRSFLILLAFLTAQAWAGPRIAPSTPYFSVYKALLADTIHDVEESKQEEGARSGAAGERELFLSLLTRFERDATAELPDFTLAKSFEWAHGAGEVLASRARLEEVRNQESGLSLIPSQGADSGEHSMKDAALYAANRLGPAAFECVRAGRVSPEVFGGSLESLLANPAYPGQKLVRVPSTYESWGIQKYLDVSAEQVGPPRLVYVVPPIQQYLEHYRAILEIAQSRRNPDLGHAPPEPKVWLHRADRESFFREISVEVKSLAAQFAGMKPEHAALGYYSQWESALASPASPWVLKSVTHKDGAAGWLHGKVMELEHKESADDPSAPTTVRVLTLASERTLWGEASAQLTEAVLQEFPELRGFFFLGSAGAPSGKLPLYGLGIPARFQLNGKPVELENALAPGAGPGQTVDHRGVVIGTGGTHGNSSSPGEQTQAWVAQQLRAGVDTIDVEQSRVAETVSRFNSTHRRKVRFGAINLITDRPSSVKLQFNDPHSLDQVDPQLKSKARISAVERVLKTIERLKRRTWEVLLLAGRRKAS